MKSEYRSLVAIAASVLFLILWYTVISPPQKPQPGETAAQSTQAPVAAGQVVAQPQGAQPQQPQDAAKAAAASAQTKQDDVKDPNANVPIKNWTIRNDLVEVELTNDGAVPIGIKLLKFNSTTDKNSPLINLVTDNKDLVPYLSLSFSDASFSFPTRPKFVLASADEKKARFVWKSDQVEIAKIIELKDSSYLADVTVEIRNLGKQPVSAKPTLTVSGINMPEKKKSFLSFGQGPSSEMLSVASFVDGKAKREADVAKMLAQKIQESGAILWSGIESRYFLSAVIPRVQSEGLSTSFGAVDLSTLAQGARGLWVSTQEPMAIVPAGDMLSVGFSVYAGPKELNALKSVGVKLEDAIDYGWFTVIAVPIVYVLKFFYSLINNYGIAIILLTIFAKLLLHPINVKSLKSMKAMQQLQPRLKELQQKYKDDKQRINQETMTLFRSHKVNPMGGCLPMLLQFPIYIALYKVLWNSIELYHAPFFWFYKDLSAPDPYFITPILLGIFMVAQQKLMPSTSADPAQQKMMMLMPIMFTVFMLFLPVGLVVYILVNTVMSVTQQWMYNHNIPLLDIVKGKVSFKRIKDQVTH